MELSWASNSLMSSQKSGQSNATSKTLHQAAREGDASAVTRILNVVVGAPSVTSSGQLSDHGPIDALDELKFSPLHYAARHNHLEVIKTLLGATPPANPLVEGDEGCTPVHLAAKHGTSQTLSELLAALGVQQAKDAVLLADIYGSTPVHFACLNDNVETLTVLHKFNPTALNARDKADLTPLHVAMHDNDVNAVSFLLNAGADYTLVDDEGKMPLHHAAYQGAVDAARTLLDFVQGAGDEAVKEQMSATDFEGHTALSMSVYSGNIDMLKLLFSFGAVPTTKASATRRTPLHTAARLGDLAAAKLLVMHGAPKHPRDYLRQTPLHRAAQFGRLETVKFLLETEDDRAQALDARTKAGLTPLAQAAHHGHHEVVRFLLQLNANPLALDKLSRTPLHLAVEDGNVECVSVLLDKARTMSSFPLGLSATDDDDDDGNGDDTSFGTGSIQSEDDAAGNPMLEAKDKYDRRPLHVACIKGHLAVAQLLVEAGCSLSAGDDAELSPLHHAVKNDNLAVAKLLLEHDSRAQLVNAEDDKSQTAIHYAARIGNHRLVELLIDHGADVNAEDDNHQTPVAEAALAGRARSVRVLLDNDADFARPDKGGSTPLHMAARHNHDVVTSVLLEYQADPAIQDRRGLTCLDVAAMHGSEEVAKILLNHPSWRNVLSRRVTSDHSKYNRDSKQLGMTPLKRLVALMPESALIVLNKCISTELTLDHEDYTINYDYSLVDDPKNAGQSVLGMMVQLRRGDLLLHPLMSAYLNHKWRQVGQPVFAAHLLLYLSFLAMLTLFVADNRVNVSLADGFELGDASVAAQFWILIFVVMSVIGEVFQLLQARADYFSWRNVLDWSVYVTCMLVIFPLDDRREQQWYAASIAIFLAWMNLVVFVQRLPVFGTYILMFTDTFATVVKVLTVFSLFIIAFAMAFYIMLQDQLSFSTPGKALSKTLVMMTGEFEYDSIFLAGCDPVVNATVCGDLEPCRDPDCPFDFPGTMYFFFVLFIVLMNIILMNLLIGLAVGDIEKVSQSAAINRQIIKARYIIASSTWVPRRLRPYLATQTIKPNAGKGAKAKKAAQKNMAAALFELLTTDDDGQAPRIEDQLSTESERDALLALRHDIRRSRHEADDIEERLQRLTSSALTNIDKLRSLRSALGVGGGSTSRGSRLDLAALADS